MPPTTPPPAVLITGANKGIGYFAALGVAKLGMTVFMVVRDEGRGQEAAAQIKAAVAGANVIVLGGVEVTQPDTVLAAAEACRKMAPQGIDVLVNNAGMSFAADTEAPFGEQARVTCDVNYYGVVHCCNAFMPLVKPGGRVVHVGSRMGCLSLLPSAERKAQFTASDLTTDALDALVESFKRAAADGACEPNGWPEHSYGMSKVALMALTRIQARAVGDKLLVLNCTPGWCRTDLTHGEGNRSAEEGADVIVWLASVPAKELTSGGFYGDRKLLDWESGEAVA